MGVRGTPGATFLPLSLLVWNATIYGNFCDLDPESTRSKEDGAIRLPTYTVDEFVPFDQGRSESGWPTGKKFFVAKRNPVDTTTELTSTSRSC